MRQGWWARFSNRGVDVNASLATRSGRVKLHGAVRLQIDVDPYSVLWGRLRHRVD